MNVTNSAFTFGNNLTTRENLAVLQKLLGLLRLWLRLNRFVHRFYSSLLLGGFPLGGLLLDGLLFR